MTNCINNYFQNVTFNSKIKRYILQNVKYTLHIKCRAFFASTCKNNTENRIMKTPGIYYGLIAAFCVLTLCIGMANATDLTHSATNCTGRPGFGHGHPPSPNEMITHLEQQGVDVTQVKSALQNGDTAA